ncbi:DNA polymerase III subunit epsilon [Aquabacterium sp. CECT 9606]|uniref:DNA polymerase III subunit epsilon n=1 Tax=Aquabacterium sp. CECT 9606 TaxID=2845822 RepID=UPI001E5B3E4B|nr:DNA polymerase III subunit epsilon [Aquabacterium sp. CECT 9606]CAH0348825.1 DNA polymerase III subunit epsilon [Aquabacterium sp. CECT 9606]
MSRQIFLDTETTGLSPESGDRIIEIGCVEMVNRRLTGRHLHFYLNPQRPNHEDAVRIHGLTDEFLADKPLFAAVVDEFLDYVAGSELIIHNASFDIGFLNAELRRVNKGVMADHIEGVLDTLVMAREMFPGKSNSLDALCKRLEVDNTHRTLHGALMDAELLATVYINMTRGQDALLIDAGGEEEGSQAALDAAAVDLSQFVLRVIEPSAAEAEAFDKSLADIDKASGGKTIWKTLEAVL